MTNRSSGAVQNILQHLTEIGPQQGVGSELIKPPKIKNKNKESIMSDQKRENYRSKNSGKTGQNKI